MSTDATKDYREDPAKFSCWAIVELMGHQKTAGLVCEQQIAGAGMIRVDVPNADGTTQVTRFYSPSAVYCITPVDKQLAVGYAAHYASRPITAYDLRAFIADKPVGEAERDETGDPQDFD